MFKNSLKFKILGFLLVISSLSAQAAPGISIDLGQGSQGVSSGIQILVLLTILSVAPSILLMSTCFVRFVIVFGMLRTAMGLGALPPTQILIGLSLILTFMVMQPTFTEINDTALQPFINQEIDEKIFLEKAFSPLRKFMAAQTSDKDLEMTFKLADLKEKPESIETTPHHILLVAFMLSELRKAFQIGFMLFLPFVVIDMIAASALVSVGLMFLPPTTISLPFKIVLFILIDGWAILSEGLVKSIQAVN
jgi:flagellar biosynthesis protein FliP